MTTTKQKLLRHHICSAARIVACISFLVLAIIGVSSLVRAMSLESVANENGVPAVWEVASLGNPETITVPITYWDQRQDSCTDSNRQFEWVICDLYTAGALQGVVKSSLGSDGLPVPAYTNADDAWAAHQDVFTMNVTGQDPVTPSDNFYRWFHETAVSKQYDREITFTRSGKNTYTYGSYGVFPLDDVNFSDDDSATEQGHNFHFTSHLNIPIKISADGTEKFEFLGDDDVWVFLNGQLVLDIGGLHEAVTGSFVINQDGTVTTYVDSVTNTGARTFSTTSAPTVEDMNDSRWITNYRNQINSIQTTEKYNTIDVGLQPGDVVNLDFFYAERSTTESNTKITISNMNWPISADSNIEAEVVGKVESTDNHLVEYITSITNRDPSRPLDLERLATYIDDTYAITTPEGEKTTASNKGFLPLDVTTLYYTATPSDPDSWQAVEISAPQNSTSGFTLATPLHMTPHGQPGDTLYFRYYAETSDSAGKISALTSYYTSLDGVSGVTYDYTTVTYDNTRPPKESTITVNYVYEDGSPAADPVTEVHQSGESYNIPSPKIPDHHTDQPVIRGTIYDDDLLFTVIYKRIPEENPQPEDPTPRRVTIHYVDEDGLPVADSYSEEFKEGDTYLVTSPDVAGYTTDEPLVGGTVPADDVEYTVVYTKKPVEVPVIPDTPSTPDTPTPAPDPELPTPPSSDLIDGDLSFFAPLGEIAYVPNTGIISDLVAPIFDQYFASAVLSQGFVLVTLLIFACSFAVYFSLRKYLDFTTNKAASTATRKPRPTPRDFAKTSKTSAKKTAKSAKTTKTAKTIKTSGKKAPVKNAKTKNNVYPHS